MALNTCEPCCNPEEFARLQDSYRCSILRILCDQLTQLIAITSGEAGIIIDGVVNVKETRPDSARCDNVPATSVSSQPACANNPSRRGACFFNDADKLCYLKFGATASNTDYTIKIFSNGFFSMPFPAYTGQIDVIWEATPTGKLLVTEF